jgi:hypothetical protein
MTSYRINFRRIPLRWYLRTQGWRRLLGVLDLKLFRPAGSVGPEMRPPERLLRIEWDDLTLTDDLRRLFRDPIQEASAAGFCLEGYYRIEPQIIEESAAAALLDHDGTTTCIINARRDVDREQVDWSFYSALADGKVLATVSDESPLPSPEHVISVISQGASLQDLAEVHRSRVAAAPGCSSSTPDSLFDELFESSKRLFDFWVTKRYVVPLCVERVRLGEPRR